MEKQFIVSFKMLLAVVCLLPFFTAYAQNNKSVSNKAISPNLFGLFFEDINYSADGGLYAELLQNRSFEYGPTDKREWHPLSYWDYITPGHGYGKISIETGKPVHVNNPHYVVLTAEHIGEGGVGIKNRGFDGIVVKSGDTYNFSMFAKQLTTKTPINVMVSLQTPKGKVISQGQLQLSNTGSWKKYTLKLIPTENCDTASLVVLAKTPGKLALDVISLFPEKTFKNRPNGMRADLAQMLADIKPKFIRFPGGCLTHGDGIGNMYHWKNTIGPIEQRVEQKNIWKYHQSAGLGYYEYFQFCEDIGAQPLPILPAAVSCQNSGDTWSIGGTGQQAIPLGEMNAYIQDVLDLIEWANGPATSKWGMLRAKAGHPAPFNLKYVGIGNEDKMTADFSLRFKMIFSAIKAKHPEITVIGSAGPFPNGEDFDKGWAIANQLRIPIVDEHYYQQPEWFISNQDRYDKYSRNGSAVYVGEYASWGNKLRNALAEAAYMTGLEKNGDVVKMASYAPLFAKQGFTQWNTDMIYFDNKSISPSINYYVQKIFSTNSGDHYYFNVVNKDPRDSLIAASCVRDSKSGDVILKLVNVGTKTKTMDVDLSGFNNILTDAELIELSGVADDINAFGKPASVTPVTSSYKVNNKFAYEAKPMSLTVIRIKSKIGS